MAVSEQTQSAGTLQAVPVCFLSGQASPCAFGCALQLSGLPTPYQHSFCPALSLFLLALLLLSRGSVKITDPKTPLAPYLSQAPNPADV